jgi:hypothetical protein
MSRNTVRKYLRSSEPPCFKARHYNRLIDQYEESIKEMLDNNYIGTRNLPALPAVLRQAGVPARQAGMMNCYRLDTRVLCRQCTDILQR